MNRFRTTTTVLCLITGLFVHTNEQAGHTKLKAAILLAATGAVLRYTAPPTYRLGRYVKFKTMSYKKRLAYAYPFYLKLAEFYFEATSKEARNEADLKTIVSAGYRIAHAQQSISKRFWRLIDFETLNHFKKRERLTKYPFLYYENKLRGDIAWLEYYIKHLQVGGPRPYAEKKQQMRNLLGELKRLLVEIQRSYTFEEEYRKYQADKNTTQVQTPKYTYTYDFVAGK